MRRTRAPLASRRPSIEREWRQFRLLSRDSVRRLLDSVLVSREADPMLFAIWGMALALTPPMLVAIRKIIDYPFLMRASLEEIEAVATGDRAFFVVYGMLATALLASLLWDALFPDRVDQEILAALPVRPRTLAAGRLAAALTVGTVFAAAINLPAAVIYSSASSVHPLLGSFPRILAGHVLSTMLGCAFVFLALMSLRAIVAICAGERIADRLAIVLQLVTVVLLIEVFLFLPAVMPRVVGAIRGTQNAQYGWLPPVWFAALFSWIAEGRGFLLPFARFGLIATGIVALTAVVVSLVPAAWMGRRVLETRSREHADRTTRLARALTDLSVRTPAVRSLVIFGVASLTRSRRHLLLLATYVGLAIATGILKLLPAIVQHRLVYERPTQYLLALPLIFNFFAVFGLRAAFAIPTELDANWPFRLTPPSVTHSIKACRVLIVWCGLVPIALATLIVTLPVWATADAMGASLFTLLSGLILTELALANWTKVPFAAAHEPTTETVKARWPAYLVALYFYSFALAYRELAALKTVSGTLTFVCASVAIVVSLRVWRTRTLRKRSLTFEVPTPGPETLNLSEAAS